MDHTAVSRQHAALRADMDVVRTYGVARPDEFGGISWVSNEPEVGISVWFTHRVAAHAVALGALLVQPDRLQVHQSRFSEAALAAVQEDASNLGRQDHSLRSSSRSLDRVRITLVAWGESAAAELHRRHGDAVELTVGVLPFPPCAGDRPIPLPEPPPTDIDAPLDLQLHLDTTTMRAGADGQGALQVTNVGPAAIRIHTGRLVGWVYRPDSSEAVSVGSGDGPQPGILMNLAPGRSSKAPVTFRTASYDPTVGYRLPSGSYEVLTVLEFRIDDDPAIWHLRSPRVHITLV